MAVRVEPRTARSMMSPISRNSAACARTTSPGSWKNGASIWSTATTSAPVTTDVTMTRGKPLPVGPVFRLPKGVASWRELAAMTPAEILRRDLFPLGFRPLSHPLHTVGHQLFPQIWIKFHPEHQRFDVDFDIPETYSARVPPPALPHHAPDLGDVSRGHEITQANFRELFEGILTPEQFEGLRLLVTKFPTTWFNQTKHRVTERPGAGHGLLRLPRQWAYQRRDRARPGHPADAGAERGLTRPPCVAITTCNCSARGGRSARPTTSPRSRSISTAISASSPNSAAGSSTSPARTGWAISMPSSPGRPLPKLDRFGRLIAAKASPAELRGEALFFGKARCASCHPAPTYTDDKMHDLRVEEFYQGRAQGWIKTFSLRGIKDSPPYFHDGRLPTLEDTVEFFNLVFELKLGDGEKSDLVAFLRQL